MIMLEESQLGPPTDARGVQCTNGECRPLTVLLRDQWDGVATHTNVLPYGGASCVAAQECCSHEN
jgi:hypothetical protein